MNKKALITGITGQDGSYLAEFLLYKGYEVHGIIRRASNFNTERIDHIYNNPKLKLHYGDLADSNIINHIVNNIQPDEIYNLAAQSHVKVSFEMPEYTGDITGLGVTRLLEAIRTSRLPIKFYQASSSELFGSADAPQSETTPFQPQSPYACAKLYGYWNVVNYRTGYDIHASNGILFNHCSPRRGQTFVTKKIVDGIRDIYLGKKDVLELGNLYAYRDWGFAPEYVKLMWEMLQQDKPGDYVIGTGETHTVKYMLNVIFEQLQIFGHWVGEGEDEKYITHKQCGNIKPNQTIVQINPKYYRPNEVDILQADCTEAKNKLNWDPEVQFKNIVEIMVYYSFGDMDEPPFTISSKTMKLIKQYNKWTTLK